MFCFNLVPKSFNSYSNSAWAGALSTNSLCIQLKWNYQQCKTLDTKTCSCCTSRSSRPFCPYRYLQKMDQKRPQFPFSRLHAITNSQYSGSKNWLFVKNHEHECSTHVFPSLFLDHEVCIMKVSTGTISNFFSLLRLRFSFTFRSPRLLHPCLSSWIPASAEMVSGSSSRNTWYMDYVSIRQQLSPNRLWPIPTLVVQKLLSFSFHILSNQQACDFFSREFFKLLILFIVCREQQKIWINAVGMQIRKVYQTSVNGQRLLFSIALINSFSQSYYEITTACFATFIISNSNSMSFNLIYCTSTGQLRIIFWFLSFENLWKSKSRS